MEPLVTTILWQFIRGDLSVADFEPWLYAQSDLERDLGNNLYMAVVSFDYRDQTELFVLRQKLAAALRSSLGCECVTLADIAVVPMGCDGQDERLFANLSQASNYGPDKWWLTLERCQVCGQHWMVAQEDRIFDDYFLKRLNPPDAEAIVDAGKWPQDFSSYEKVLTLGLRMSRACRFPDEFATSLIDTTRDLRRDRPDISIEEIAELLGIETEHARELLSRI
jgi:hypothetical protein